MTQSVVSAGDTRLLAGIGLGAVNARIELMVVLVEEFRLTSPTSASVPVFTDQRSTPHWANSDVGTTSRSTANNKRLRRRCCIIQPPDLFRGPLTTGNNSRCERNEYGFFVKVAKTCPEMGRRKSKFLSGFLKGEDWALGPGPGGKQKE